MKKFNILKEKTYDGIPLTKEFVLLDIKALLNVMKSNKKPGGCGTCPLNRGIRACPLRDLADCTDIYNDYNICPIPINHKEEASYLSSFLPSKNKESIE